MLHLPTLLVLSFVTSSVVTLLLLLTRLSLRPAAAGALTWVVADTAFQLSRLATLAERHPELLPTTLASAWPAVPPVVVPGVLLVAAVWCHIMALRRAAGATLTLRRRALELAGVVAPFSLALLQIDSFEPRVRLLAATLVLLLMGLTGVALRLARQYWGARMVALLACVGMLANLGRATGLLTEPAVADNNALSALFLVNIGTTLAATMGFVVLLQEQVRHQMLTLSITDPLTGLLNRRGVLEALERDLGRAERGNQPIAVALFDLDHFKHINDSHGHAAGDAVLAGFADCLRSHCRRGDVIGRWGGEEFVVAMPGTDAATAHEVANRVRVALRGRAWGFGQGSVTVSAGVAQARPARDGSAPRPGVQAAQQLITQADQRLYRAKEQRDRVCNTDHGALNPA